MDPLKEGETRNVEGDCATMNSTDKEQAVETDLDAFVEPAVGMEFESDEEAHRFFNSYAKWVGFKTKIRQSQKSKRLGKCFVHFSCSKEGFKETRENASNARPETRCGCLAGMKVRLNESGKWKAIEVNLQHNHLVCPTKEGSLENLDDRLRKRLKLGVKSRHRVQVTSQENVSEAEECEHPTFEEIDCHDHITKVRQLTRSHEDSLMTVPSLGGEETRDREGDCGIIKSVDKEQAIEGDLTACVVPTVGMEFELDEEAHRFFISYAKQVGFKTKIRQSQKSKRLGKCFVHFSCSKEGFKETKETASKGRPDTRCGCSAGMKVRLNDLGKWKVAEVNLQHNHLVGHAKVHNHLSSPTNVVPHKHLNEDLKKKLELYRLKRKRRLELSVKTHYRVEKKFQNVTDAGCEHLTFEEGDRQNHIANSSSLKQSHRDALMVAHLMEGGKTGYTEGDCALINSVNKEHAVEVDQNACLVPLVGMEFESDEEAHRFFNSYAKEVGFTTRIRQSQKSKRFGRCFVHFCCNREGFKETNETVSKTRPDTRCGCLAGMKVRLNGFGKWKVLEVNLHHNHLLNPTKATSHRHLDDKVGKGLKLDETTGQQVQKTCEDYVTDAEGNSHSAFEERDCQNDASTIIQSEWSHVSLASYGPSIIQSKPDPTDVAAVARWLVSLNSWGVLSTISSDMGGAPFGNVVPFSDGIPGDGRGIPYFYLANLDPTTRNALNDERSSFTICEFPLGACGREDHENLTYTGLTLTGKLKLVNEESKEVEFAEDALFSKHAEMKNWPKDQNFQFFKLAIENIFLIDWFGGPKPLSLAQYLHLRMDELSLTSLP